MLTTLLRPGTAWIVVASVLASSLLGAQPSHSDGLSGETTPTSTEAVSPKSAPSAPVDATTEDLSISGSEALTVSPDSADSNTPYIDSTDDYQLGATEPTPEQVPQPTPQVADQPNVIDLPYLSIDGLPEPPTVEIDPGTFALQNGLQLGSGTASQQDYYRRMVRLPGRVPVSPLRLIFPLTMPAPITSAFGWRIHPVFGDRRFHSGTDLGAPLGTPVLAAYAGRVTAADYLGGYGLTVILQHKDSQETLYAHLSEILVKPGDVVQQGSLIGRVGSTGNSTGPHLHFEHRYLTSEGWMAIDAGQQLEYALAQFLRSLSLAKVPQTVLAPVPTARALVPATPVTTLPRVPDQIARQSGTIQWLP
jgi:murein DD-endopeptidase MepM/ murein hydrolase activator NlpD